MSDAISSQGTTIEKGTSGSPSSFTAIAEVVSIGGPNPDSEEIDVTHLMSPGAYREFIGGFKDGGQVPLTANLLRSHLTGIIADYEAQTLSDYQIVFPQTSPETVGAFSAKVKSYAIGVAVGDKVSVNITLKVSGAVTWS